MAWLLREGEVLASLEVASSLAARSRGLLGKASFEGALLLRRTRSVHTVGMRFPIDVAFLTDDLHVDRHGHHAALPGRAPASGRPGRARGAGRCLRALEARPGRRPGDQGVSAGRQRPGELVVVATPIGNIGDLSPRAAAALQEADVVCCEDTRHTGQLLSRLGLRASRLVSVHSHNERERVGEILEMLEGGARVALVSDAGTPTISDPGEQVIAAAIDAGHKVTTVPDHRRPSVLSWSPGSGPHAGGSRASCQDEGQSAASVWARSLRPRIRA